MKVKPFALAGAAGALIFAGAASGAFEGLSIESFVGEDWIDPDRPDEQNYATYGLVTYRLYANFSGEDTDGVLSVFGIGGLPISVNSDDGLFHNATIDSLTAPQDLRFIDQFENQWDTYVTINKTDSDRDATTTSPGFATATNDLAMNWSDENAGWFVTPDDMQSRADFGDDPGRVLLAQFSVADTDANNVFGIVNLLLLNNDQLEQLEFTTATPAPGALALLGLAGLAGTRRRRG